ALTLTGCTLARTGQPPFPTRRSSDLSGSTHALNGELDNAGTATWTAGDLQMHYGTLVNSGTFTANSASTLSSYDITYPGGTNAFTNTGTFTAQGDRKSTRQNSSHVATSNDSVSFNINAGTLALNSGGTHTGNFA